MSFTRSKVLSAALLAMLAVSTPSIAGDNSGYQDHPMMGGDNDDYGYGNEPGEDYGAGSGWRWRMMREWMREHPGWMMHRWMQRGRHDEDRDHGYGPGSGWRWQMMREWMEEHPGSMMHRWMHGDEDGDGRGYGNGPGMGSGYGQRGWMMRRFGGGGPGFGGMGPGMMYGYGNGARRDLNLSTDDVKNYLNRMIRNPNLTVGSVKEKDNNTITAEIVTKEGNSLVQTLDFNRHTGFVRPEQQSGTTGRGETEPQGRSQQNGQSQPGGENQQNDQSDQGGENQRNDQNK